MRHVRVVVVSPMHASNVGAIARLCGNFAVTDVFVVAPRCDVESNEAKMLATHHATDLLASFKVVTKLKEAITGAGSVVGFSRRVGDLRRPDLSWSDLPHCAESTEQLCLVFGPEDTGLSHDDLTLCTHVCALPTHPRVPSMNLSQAVAVVLAGVFWQARAADETPVVKTRFEDEKPIAPQSLLSLIEHWRAVMVDVGLTKDGNPDRLLHYYHRLLNRAQISEREGSMLRGFLSQIQITLGTRKTKKESDDVSPR